ncbi:hypothetical protein [Ruminococcus sp.]|uniref:hypothetical protein n=1 Tax=Ruminococcus sp. TaxID=41978 RepID=UPI001B472E8A|nr:hypothetical protein [Ruminococcus sp.]MBP5433241.1 hypothetical protein [Ruminococcus sp.]
MAVNNMSIEQAATVLSAIHSQVTGYSGVTPTDVSDFVSVAQATLQAGYDSVIAAISQVISKTLIAVRPYNRKFKGLEVSNERWGGITRKINFADRGPMQDDTYALVDGSPVDQFVVRTPDVLETRYYGSNVYQGQYTIFTKQLDVAFSGPEAFAAFMSGLMTHFSNEREQWLEDGARMILMNLIAAKADAGIDVFHLLTEYNTVTGLSPALDAQTVMQPDNFPAFVKWMYGRVANLSSLMTERSKLFQLEITGKPILRHTPLEDQKVYLNSQFLNDMTARVLADTYHENFLRYSDVEAVNFWQAIDDPLDVSCTPVYIDNTGTITVASGNVAVSDVIGVMFDRDAVGYNIYDDSIEASPYNAAGQYYNLFSHVRVQFQNDLTEKAVVLCLD